MYTGHRREKVQHEDGRKANHFYLLDVMGGEHLAVVGEERDTRDGHYLYRAMPPFDVLHPANWGNATSVVEWLNSLVGSPVDKLSAGAAPMDWQPPAAGEEKLMRDSAPPRPKLAPGVTASGQPLDSWPPPPPPPRSQLALPALPPVKMPQPPAQPPPKTVEDIRAAAAAARAAALGGLVARAEGEAARRSLARRAAADWLRGELTEEEVELLRANITGLAETLAEIDALPAPMDAAPAQLANGPQSRSSSAAQPSINGQPDGVQPLCNGVADAEQEQAEPLKLRVKRAWLVTEALDFLRKIGSSYLPLRVQASTGVIAAIAAAAKHQDSAVSLLAKDFLAQLRASAEAHLAVLASREFSTDPRASLAARLPDIAATADAVVEAEAAGAVAVQRAAVAAAQAARPKPPAPPAQHPAASQPAKAPASSADQQTAASVGGGANSVSVAQPQQWQDQGAEAASGFSHPHSPAVGLDGKKLTTKPRTPHPKNLLAKSAAAAAAAARKSDGGPSWPASPPQPQLPWVADPAGKGAAPPGDVQAATHAHGASLSEDGSGGGGRSRPSTAGTAAGGSDSDIDEWVPPDDHEIHLLDGEQDAGPLGNAAMVLGKGKGCLQACRFAEVPGVVHAIIGTALEQLQQSPSWQSNASFARSFQEKVAVMQKEAGRLSPDKAKSTNRKAKQTITKQVDALKAAVDSLSAKQSS